ncbi:MAG: hypothetical protein A2Y78_14085 [Acidobacteria bacterium RBG_13_68_16]|nr:MAG: hypothetical protein A2Y78_14085 [Acidobacteria bacterium RBG_13_68_16]
MSEVALWRRFLGQGEPHPVVPTDLARRLAQVRLHAARRLTASWAGAYRSAFKGEGLEFAGVREYLPGDDVRTIDWRVTARTGRLAVRRYVEERNRTVLFLVDVGAGTVAGSGTRTLLEVAAEVVALVGSAAIAGGDRVALSAWSDRQEFVLTPRRNDASLLRMVHELLLVRPQGRPSDLLAALTEVPRLLRRSGVLVLISPFFGSGYGRTLGALARRHELLAVRLWDRRAGKGTAKARVPARDTLGRAGWAAAGPAPEVPELSRVRADVLMVTPETLLAPILARAFLARGRRRSA